jgi:hypothetical protein
MSGIELVAFGVLWAVLVGLAALVLVLYRQVERAYAASARGAPGGLSPGTEAPGLEVLQGTEIVEWHVPDDDRIRVLAFVTTTCEACVRLLRALTDLERREGVQPVVLVQGEAQGEMAALMRELETVWIAHPPEVVTNYGITIYPLVYVVRGRTVLASRSVASRGDLSKLVTEAQGVGENVAPSSEVTAERVS